MSEPFPSDEALRWTEIWRREHADTLAIAADPVRLITLETFRQHVQFAINLGLSYEAYAALLVERSPQRFAERHKGALAGLIQAARLCRGEGSSQ